MMSKRCETYWMRQARGVTLVEAVVGAALMGTLLTAVVLANARFTVQARSAEVRLEACRIADELLGNWFADENVFPKNTGGEIAAHPGWRWQTARSENKSATELDAEVVSLKVFAPGSENGQPAVEVELLLPRESDETPDDRTDID